MVTTMRNISLGTRRAFFLESTYAPIIVSSMESDTRVINMKTVFANPRRILLSRNTTRYASILNPSGLYKNPLYIIKSDDLLNDAIAT